MVPISCGEGNVGQSNDFSHFFPRKREWLGLNRTRLFPVLSWVTRLCSCAGDSAGEG